MLTRFHRHHFDKDQLRLQTSCSRLGLDTRPSNLCMLRLTSSYASSRPFILAFLSKFAPENPVVSLGFKCKMRGEIKTCVPCVTSTKNDLMLVSHRQGSYLCFQSSASREPWSTSKSMTGGTKRKGQQNGPRKNPQEDHFGGLPSYCSGDQSNSNSCYEETVLKTIVKFVEMVHYGCTSTVNNHHQKECFWWQIGVEINHLLSNIHDQLTSPISFDHNYPDLFHHACSCEIAWPKLACRQVFLVNVRSFKT